MRLIIKRNKRRGQFWAAWGIQDNLRLFRYFFLRKTRRIATFPCTLVMSARMSWQLNIQLILTLREHYDGHCSRLVKVSYGVQLAPVLETYREKKISTEICYSVALPPSCNKSHFGFQSVWQLSKKDKTIRFLAAWGMQSYLTAFNSTFSITD